MARAKLRRRHQFNDLIGTGVAFKHKPDIGDYVDSMAAPRPLSLDQVEEHMRAAYVEDMRYQLLRRGIAHAGTLEPFVPKPKPSHVDPTHDARQAAYRNATIQEQTATHAASEARKAARAANHPSQCK